MLNSGYDWGPFYIYHDGRGRRVGAVLRLDHPTERKQVFPLQATNWRCNPRFEAKAIRPPTPLYNLHLLAAAPIKPVLLVEGEKAADAGSVRFEAHVALSEAAENFDGEETCRKQWDKIRLRTDGPPLTMATYFKQARDLGWKPAGRPKPKADGPSQEDASGPGDSVGGGSRSSKTDQALLVLEQADGAGDEHWCDQDGQPYATFTLEERGASPRRVHAPVESVTYRGVLQHRFLEDAVTKVLSSEQESRAVALLNHRARTSGEQHPVFLRSAMLDDAIYIDLGRSDGQVLHVKPDGYALTSEPPVRFVSGSRSALPLPEPGGTLADFQRHFNVSPADLKRVGKAVTQGVTHE